MKPEDMVKLLGGYATGTLTGQEREALFHAALSNQELFNALADEQALKELLDDPDLRQQLLSRLQPARPPFARRYALWLGRPAAWAVAGGAAVALVIAFIALRLSGPVLTPEPPLEAMRDTSAAPEAAYSVRTPASPKAAIRQETQAKQPEPESKEQPSGVARTPEKPALMARSRRSVEREELPAPPPLQEPAVEQSAGGGAAGRFPAPAPPPPPAQMSQALPMAAQIRDVAGARELYYASQGRERAASNIKAKVASAVPRQTLGVRYSLLRSTGEGSYAEVDPRTILRTGEEIRLAVEPNEDGYLYVMLENTAGAWELLFNHRVERMTRYLIPTNGPVRLAEPGGELKLLVVLSRQAAAELGSTPALLKLADQESRGSQLNVLARDLRAGVEERSFLTEKVNEAATGGKKKEVVYVVAPPAQRSRRVVVEIPVKYR